jgi:molybdopterin converting factor small subunit
VGLITVEFFGIPRRRAGRAELTVAAGTVGQALAEVMRECPGLGELVLPEGRLAPHYLLSVGGRVFVTDLNQAVDQDTRLLLLSADAGG